MNDGHTTQYPVARLPTTPEEVITFVGKNFTHEYLNGWSGAKVAPADVRYEISVGALLESFRGLAAREPVDIEPVAWAYKQLVKYGAQAQSAAASTMMDRLAKVVVDAGHE